MNGLGGISLENEGIERIESEKVLVELAQRRDLREYTAFGGVRIDVVEMLEVGRIFEVTEGRHAVTLGFLLGARRPKHWCRWHRDGRSRAGTDRERFPAAEHFRGLASGRPPERHWREPVLAAFA